MTFLKDRGNVNSIVKWSHLVLLDYYRCIYFSRAIAIIFSFEEIKLIFVDIWISLYESIWKILVLNKLRTVLCAL